MLRRLTKETIKMIPNEVLGGKSKYQIAKELRYKVDIIDSKRTFTAGTCQL
jgi:hypothetical protein